MLSVLILITAAMRHHFVLSDEVLRPMKSTRLAEKADLQGIGTANRVVTATGGEK